MKGAQSIQTMLPRHLYVIVGISYVVLVMLFIIMWRITIEISLFGFSVI